MNPELSNQHRRYCSIAFASRASILLVSLLALSALSVPTASAFKASAGLSMYGSLSIAQEIDPVTGQVERGYYVAIATITNIGGVPIAPSLAPAIIWTMSGVVSPDGSPGVFDVYETGTIAGGTGIFVDSSGSLVQTGILSLATSSFAGSISQLGWNDPPYFTGATGYGTFSAACATTNCIYNSGQLSLASTGTISLTITCDDQLHAQGVC